jgi:hypothetical protein
MAQLLLSEKCPDRLFPVAVLFAFSKNMNKTIEEVTTVYGDEDKNIASKGEILVIIESILPRLPEHVLTTASLFIACFKLHPQVKCTDEKRNGVQNCPKVNGQLTYNERFPFHSPSSEYLCIHRLQIRNVREKKVRGESRAIL